MAINKGLGKGLAALLQDLVEEENKNESAAASQKTTASYRNADDAEGSNDADQSGRVTVSEIPISLVDQNPNQPRRYFDDTALRELAASIKTYGILQPLILVRFQERYVIVAGERRYRAAKIAGLTTVPAIVRELSPQDIKEIAIIENLQREDLNPIEAAVAIKELMITYKMTQDELSQKIGKSRPTVTNLLRLLSLAPSVIVLVRTGKLSAGHARALVVVENREMQEKLANNVIMSQMSVRELENQVKLFSARGVMPEFGEKPQKEKRSKELKDLINSMKRVLGTKVKVIGNDNKGRICIDYFTRDDLDRICSIIEILKKTDLPE
jgi:ParB family chromosome partitioning protein